MGQESSDAQELEERLRNRIKRLRRTAEKSNRRAAAEGFLDGVIATLRPGDLVVDCGANVGSVTLRLAQSGADVVAFEPDPWSFKQLEQATADYDNVTRINAAVGVEAGTLSLYRSGSFEDDRHKESIRSSLMADARSVDASGDAIPVEVIDFPAWLQARLDEGRRIGMVKMDIEGAELDLMEVLLDRGVPDQTGPFLVETHPGLFPKKRARFAALAERAKNYPAKRVNLDWI
ncbi:methyltransferase, FkbM family [Epibacterium ulvae]|uniref:Methyltransferase, FkbM family n=1 Tax=Epibacterium ulvae TaxID=1156985 RepID=A0A1G5R3Z8_9RHOB|nr:FkbM family methyltransferase [Epibacterium ulvae]SCZ68747.1 methyltransferase, FkbM family [Epibacterium ulvae]